MKNLLILAVFSFGSFVAGFSQVNPNAIGVRGGAGNNGSGVELSYQKGMGDANRLELDLGFRGSSLYSHLIVTGLYHWVKNITSGLNWYIGPGAQVGLYSYKNSSINGGVTLALGGQLGLEFDFSSLDIPFLISIDTRPMWGFNGGSSGLNWGGNAAIRYLF
jgi:hypothetical protein